MRVKLRPGTHFAPVPQGIYWTRAGRSFLLTAPAGLYLALDSQLDLLTRGTDVDELATALGESARPAVQRILDTLLDRDMLLDLDRAGAPPAPGEADRYAEVLSYLEAHCADPYRVFARLRATVVPVLGDGPAAAVARRTITGYGAAATATVPPGADLVVLVDDADRPLDLVAAAASLPAGTRVVPVHAGRRIALVGSPETGGLAEFVALARRAGDWAAAEPDGAAPRPLSAVLAGSLATHAVLGALTGTLPAEPAPSLVHGHDVQVQRLPRSPVPAAGDTPEAMLDRLGPLLARWTGPYRRDRDLDLAQMPMSLATAELVAGRGRVAGWGDDRAQAVLSVCLAAARAAVGPAATGIAAAGPTLGHWRADGALRLLGAALLATSTGTATSWEDLPAAARTLWSLLDEHYERAVRVRSHPLPGLDWVLVEVTSADGTVRAAEWGETLELAAWAALSAAVAQAQATPEVHALLAADRVGTHRLAQTAGDRLRRLTDQLDALLAARGERIAGEPDAPDPVVGDAPLVSGPVVLR
ncbi:hypothetical protein ACFO0M_15435 [Micromonospora mangrovi]|uniref:Uncharacterized protein n=2 Tax=Micromonospora TaxID=1873 RepID=A0AAU8HH50_9ACTN